MEARVAGYHSPSLEGLNIDDSTREQARVAAQVTNVAAVPGNLSSVNAGEESMEILEGDDVNGAVKVDLTATPAWVSSAPPVGVSQEEKEESRSIRAQEPVETIDPVGVHGQKGEEDPTAEQRASSSVQLPTKREIDEAQTTTIPKSAPEEDSSVTVSEPIAKPTDPAEEQPKDQDPTSDQAEEIAKPYSRKSPAIVSPDSNEGEAPEKGEPVRRSEPSRSAPVQEETPSSVASRLEIDAKEVEPHGGLQGDNAVVTVVEDAPEASSRATADLVNVAGEDEGDPATTLDSETKVAVSHKQPLSGSTSRPLRPSTSAPKATGRTTLSSSTTLPHVAPKTTPAIRAHHTGGPKSSKPPSSFTREPVPKSKPLSASTSFRPASRRLQAGSTHPQPSAGPTNALKPHHTGTAVIQRSPLYAPTQSTLAKARNMDKVDQGMVRERVRVRSGASAGSVGEVGTPDVVVKSGVGTRMAAGKGKSTLPPPSYRSPAEAAPRPPSRTGAATSTKAQMAGKASRPIEVTSKETRPSIAPTKTNGGGLSRGSSLMRPTASSKMKTISAAKDGGK